MNPVTWVLIGFGVAVVIVVVALVIAHRLAWLNAIMGKDHDAGIGL